ncbi:hypothetical protein Cpir12675_004911 [Ceratocystis pirilliformis]|uniref:SIS domain-containing protein n=1 Tax=Ceratocystis pirilliformis TaxID=259994 RepID=A0ABR3YUQ8_9PEZI
MPSPPPPPPGPTLPLQTSAVVVPRKTTPDQCTYPAPPSPAASSHDDSVSTLDECSISDMDLSLKAGHSSTSNLTRTTSIASASAASRRRGTDAPPAVEPATTAAHFSSMSPSSPPSSTSPLSPTSSLQFADRLASANHVLSTEAAALAAVTHLYATHSVARAGFNAAVSAIVRNCGEKGKLVIIGVGKSGIIARKLVATFSSLGLCAIFLHPTDALHGDLGYIQPRDTLLVITYSGKTPELLLLQDHLPSDLPTILLTAHTRPSDCAFIRARPATILLPTPIPTPEKKSFGVSAPTTSTTTALAVGDALAVTAAHELHSAPGSLGLATVFARNHPGGAIGAALQNSAPPDPILRDLLALSFAELPLLEPCAGSRGALTGADALRAGFDAANTADAASAGSGWLRLCDGSVLPPSRIRALRNDQLLVPIGQVPGLVVARDEMLGIAADTQVRVAKDLVRSAHAHVPEGAAYLQVGDAIIALLDEMGQIVGALEANQVLSQ